MDKAVSLIRQAQGEALSRGGRPFQFLLIIDEADDFYRTEAGCSKNRTNDDSVIQMEKAMA